MFWTRAILWKIIKVLVYLIGMIRYYPARKKKYFFVPYLTRPHSPRHTFTTRLVEAGVNIKVIQNLCGHSRSDVTFDIYTTVTKELKQAEFDDFQKKLKEKKQKWKNRQEKDA